MNGATVGKLIAGAVFLAVAGVIGISVARSGTKPGSPSGPAIEAMEAPSGNVTVVDLPTNDAAMSTLLGVGQAPVWRQVDENGNLKAEILADSLEPEKGGRIRLIRPRATFPTDDGRRVEVTAAEGSIIRRSGGEPESGDLSGGVTIRVVRTDPASPDATRIVGTFRTETLHFEESRREITTTDTITIDAHGATFRGRGLTLRMDDRGPSNSTRLLFLRIQDGGELQIEPRTFGETLRGQQNTPSPNQAPDASEHPSGAPVESFYRIVAGRDVDLHWGPASVRSDRMEIGARLVNGELAPGALLEFPTTMPTAERAVSGGATGAQESPALPTTATLAWTGPLELQLVDARPADIAPDPRDEVAVKWIGVGRGSVRAQDPSMDVFAEAAEIRYGATSGRVRMVGKDGVRTVDLRGASWGELHSDHAEIDLGAMPDIVAWVNGPGTMIPVAKPGSEIPRVSWTERADLTAVRDPSGEVVPTSVSASGDVTLGADGWTLQSKFARAFLVHREGNTELDRVLLRDGFRAESAASSESFAGSDAEVFFGRPVPGEMVGDAVSAVLTGSVRLTRDEVRIEADSIAAEFFTGPDGNPDVAAADATGSVHAVLRSGVEVRGPRATVGDDGKTVSVSGPASTVTITNGDQTLAIVSESMEVRRSEGRVVAYGPGSAEQRIAPTPDTPGVFATMNWSDGLVYDDTTGIAELMGEVKGERTVELAQVQRFTALGGAAIAITPGVLKDDQDAKAEVISVVLDGYGQTQAEVETRMYASPDAGGNRGPLEALIALRSAQIAFDIERERVTTPGAGVVVAEDRRARESGEGSDVGLGQINVGGRGTTAFRWNDSFALDLGAARAEMIGGVRVSHVDAETSSITEVHAERVNADLVPGFGGVKGPDIRNMSDVLRSVTALTRVRVEHKNYLVECEALDFDVVGNLFTARATEGNRVRAIDRVQGTSVMAQEVTIDPRTGNLVADGVSGITSGR